VARGFKQTRGLAQAACETAVHQAFAGGVVLAAFDFVGADNKIAIGVNAQRRDAFDVAQNDTVQMAKKVERIDAGPAWQSAVATL